MNPSILLSLFVVVEAYQPLKILINSPTVGYSHVNFHGQLADLLVDAGHEVHFHIPTWEAKEKRNGTRKAHKVVRISAPVEPQDTKVNVDDHELNRNPFETKQTGNGDNSDEYLNAIVAFCKMQLEDREYLNSIVSEKFDVAIAEQIDICAFYFFHVANIPTTLTTSTMISSFGMIAEAYGLETRLSYQPGGMCFSSTEMPNLSFLERVRNIYRTFTVCSVIQSFQNKVQSLFSDHFSRPMPYFTQLLGKTAYAFVNSAEALEHPQPITRKIRAIGGITLNLSTANRLTPELEKIYANADRGVVLLSFGSNIESNLMRKELKSEVLRAFARFPEFQFIWRISVDSETAKMINQVPNVHPITWVDQRAILADNRTKLFISHCGANSVLEAAFEGVPVVAVPFFNDQFSNSGLLLSRKTAVLLRRNYINEENLVAALNQTLNDPQFLFNAQNLKKQIRLHPENPQQSFVRYVEYAAEFDAGYLDLPSKEMSFVVLYNLDVYTAVLVFFFVTFLAIHKLFSTIKKKMKTE
ncbi:Glucuronosyltransferase [Aphelenchoides besseyi]|nr:Glucuronosyltransferase [Aphelenchoides besseyi]KAI6208890.1 Glucuronosyltransferase [Aphelenchoides besseyi]